MLFGEEDKQGINHQKECHAGSADHDEVELFIREKQFSGIVECKYGIVDAGNTPHKKIKQSCHSNIPRSFLT